ncbi:MAG: hypothetical protein P4L53_22080 [Candidatus Obscuribacterales bacterium]|jgi:hypothetical protein|nr:hypothetical protein [Candidatus Obscuribacterales bacterium]
MAETTVKIFTPARNYVGYFVNPKIDSFPDGEYEIEGRFFDAAGDVVGKIEYNPECLPYVAELDGIKEVKHTRLTNVYIQRGRNPIRMTGKGV